MIYQSPLNDKGQPYWVPVVVKNKEYLVGYLDSFSYVLYVLDFPGILDLNLDSSRFNDVIDDGQRLSTMSKKEIENKMMETASVFMPSEQKKKQKDHPDNKIGILKSHYLEFECHCGMYYAFNNKKEIPDENFKCGVCDRLLIEYTARPDDDFEFDGDEEIICEKLQEAEESQMRDEPDAEEEMD